ncbi:hypothetical protein MKP07_29955 [Niabella hibiscisoli]|nr:hypothetical protein [Niabella hibiscisoli]
MYHSINGKIESSWKKENGKLIVTVAVPVNSQATVYIPSTSVASVRLKGDSQLRLKKSVDHANRVEAELGSGKYQFEVIGFANPN